MKHIGIVAVTSEGASLCYRTICSTAMQKLGNNQHPEISLHHHSFGKILSAQQKRDWKQMAEIMCDSIRKVAAAGAEFVIIPGNSVHFAINLIRKKSSLPVISIVDVAVEECKKHGYRRVGVLGVSFTMTEGLYKKTLQKQGIKHPIPSKELCKKLDDIIYKEIVPAKVTKKTITDTLKIVQHLKDKGCDAVILACTELPLIVTSENSPLPVIDSTRLLALKAVEVAIGFKPV